MAVTYLFVDRQANKTVAYFSLLNDKVSYDPEERSLWNRINRRISNNKRRKTYPSVKIGRLAVSKDYDNKGVGRAILDFIKHAFTNGNRTGCRFITVDAYATSSR
jgi:GNAT superfamily N-acetyltransferase